MAPGAPLQNTAAPRTVAAAPVAAPLEGQQGDFYFVVYPSPLLGDGRGGNKPWLQELADPVSKIAWQSWIEIHPDNTVLIRTGKSDFGQGSTFTAYRQIVADELSVPLRATVN